jgi:predicted DNA-binding protein
MARKSDAIFIRLDPDLKQRLNDQAERMNTSASSLVRMGTVKLLEELEQTELSKPALRPKHKITR